MRTVAELKEIADRLAAEAAAAGLVVVVAVGVEDHCAGDAGYYVSFSGGGLAARGLVERARDVLVKGT